jgi:hypothetical protein
MVLTSTTSRAVVDHAKDYPQWWPCLVPSGLQSLTLARSFGGLQALRTWSALIQEGESVCVDVGLHSLTSFACFVARPQSSFLSRKWSGRRPYHMLTHANATHPHNVGPSRARAGMDSLDPLSAIFHVDFTNAMLTMRQS